MAASFVGSSSRLLKTWQRFSSLDGSNTTPVTSLLTNWENTAAVTANKRHAASKKFHTREAWVKSVLRHGHGETHFLASFNKRI
jgi:hypothetical protein